MDWSKWTQTETPFRVAGIENWNHTGFSGKLPAGTWYFYTLLNHNVYHIINSPSHSDYCKVTVT